MHAGFAEIQVPLDSASQRAARLEDAAAATWRTFKNVTSASMVTGVGPTGQTALNDPSGLTTTTYGLLVFRAETITAPSSLNTLVTVNTLIGATSTLLFTKTVPLAAFAVVGAITDMANLANNTNAVIRIPLGASLQMTINGNGAFNFFQQLIRIPA